MGNTNITDKPIGSFWIPSNLSGDVLIIGTTGKGKSRLGEIFGLSAEELEALSRPSLTPEQIAEEKRRKTERNAAAAARLQAIREAIWAHRRDDLEFSALQDTLSTLGITDCPSDDQQKAFFDLLPDHIVGLVVSWGFSDTEVREAIFTYAEENLQDVAQAVAAA